MCTDTLTTRRYALRPMIRDDAEALLRCYGDPDAVRRMNSDNCHGSFLIPDLPSMHSAIQAWANDSWIVRLTVLCRDENRAVGTVEYCLKEGGLLVLRLDLCSAHETADRIAELLRAACAEGFQRYPDAERVVLKAFPQDDARCSALRECGFAGERTVLGFPHYYELARQS